MESCFAKKSLTTTMPRSGTVLSTKVALDRCQRLPLNRKQECRQSNVELFSQKRKFNSSSANRRLPGTLQKPSRCLIASKVWATHELTLATSPSTPAVESGLRVLADKSQQYLFPQYTVVITCKHQRFLPPVGATQCIRCPRERLGTRSIAQPRVLESTTSPSAHKLLQCDKYRSAVRAMHRLLRNQGQGGKRRHQLPAQQHASSTRRFLAVQRR